MQRGKPDGVLTGVQALFLFSSRDLWRSQHRQINDVAEGGPNFPRTHSTINREANCSPVYMITVWHVWLHSRTVQLLYGCCTQFVEMSAQVIYLFCSMLPAFFTRE